MDQVVKVALRFLGIPQTSNFEKKLILADPFEKLVEELQKEIETDVVISKIKDIIFIKDQNHVEFYRQRKLNGVPFFSRCEKMIQNEVF